MRFVVRVDRMGAKVEIRALAVGDERIHRFERTVRDVVQSSSLPVRITMTNDGEEDRQDLIDKLRKLFVSEQAITGESASVFTYLRDDVIFSLETPSQSEAIDA